MRLAVTLAIRHEAKRDYDFLRHNYVPFLTRLDVLPVLVPNSIDDPRAYAEALELEGLVLTGGGDVDPDRYHHTNTGSIEISAQRDSVEFTLLEWAVERNLPVLAICRGIQVVNVFFGGGLVQDIPSALGNGVNHDESQHPIRIVDQALADVMGTDCPTVNSYHHQAVTEAVRAASLDVFAISEVDGVIEGLRHPTLPVLGVQWHPERPGPSEATDQRLFRHFLQTD